MSQSYEQVHNQRFKWSVEWIYKVAPKDGLIYEMGGDGPFRKMLEDARPDLTVVRSEGDLRKPSGQESGVYDGVICMEVIEHINDVEPNDGSIPTQWYGTGVRLMLAEAYRILKPKGFLFLTTPNAASINTIHKILTAQPPMVYRPHVREYTVHEINGFCSNAGFRLERLETLESWNNCMSEQSHRAIGRFIKSSGHTSKHRGENIFSLFRKDY